MYNDNHICPCLTLDITSLKDEFKPLKWGFLYARLLQTHTKRNLNKQDYVSMF